MNGSLLIHEECIQSLIDSIPTAVLIVQDYSIVHANRAIIHMHGYNSLSEVIGRDIFSFGAQFDKERLRKFHDDNICGKNTGKLPLNVKTRDGRLVKIQGYPNRIVWNNRPAVLNVVHNLSESVDNRKSFREKPGESTKPPYKLRFGALDNKDPRLNILGSCKAMQKLYEQIIKASLNDANILILGETGSGKEIVARLIHDMSNHNNGNFIAMNCSAINDHLFESEFFGHKKGAFTGALSNRTGYFGSADGGTLFLDEIGDLSLEGQKKILRLFDSGEYIPVGCVKPRKSSARIIMATNKDPVKLVEKGLMREDFFYRIYTVVLSVPPLRERMGDLPILIEHFLEHSAYPASLSDIPDEVMAAFEKYHWPGNVRELKNTLMRYLTLGNVEFVPLKKPTPGFINRISKLIQKGNFASDEIKMKLEIEAFEKMMISEALAQTDGNKSKAAEMLGIPRNSFIRKIQTNDILSAPNLKDF